tara:strand:+ start:410 stop:1144 length:735 start_codon:yes stop_codon:yes gene_type:complete
MDVSFIIPCLNCENFIENTVHKLVNKLKKIKNINYELIFIDDGSVDKTEKILKKYTSKKIRVFKNIKNLGKSASLIKGIRASKKSKIVIIDCDLPYFSYLETVLKKLKNNSFTYINRKSPKSKLSNKKMNLYQISRFFIGRIICFILSLFFFNDKIGDTQAGLKAFPKPKNLKNIKFISKKFFLDAELMILFYRAKAQMVSIPVNYKIYSKSTIKILSFENFVYLYELLKIILFYKFTNKKFIF